MRFLPLLLLLLANGCADNSVAPGDPDLRSVNAAELQAELVALDAEIVVLNAWATWCLPCRYEFPEFTEFGRRKAADGVVVRFLSMDYEGEVPEAIAFLKEQEVEGVTYIKAPGTTTFLRDMHPRWSGGIPASFVYDGDGNLLDFWEGMVDYEVLDRRVAAARAQLDGGDAEETPEQDATEETAALRR
ncbi:MAG: TlpA disulfide reductase family protein [Bacteroidota bacterium]